VEKRCKKPKDKDMQVSNGSENNVSIFNFSFLFSLSWWFCFLFFFKSCFQHAEEVLVSCTALRSLSNSLSLLMPFLSLAIDSFGESTTLKLNLTV
jgi:hypothetical protein